LLLLVILPVVDDDVDDAVADGALTIVAVNGADVDEKVAVGT
jgi:hypothetical protein